MSRRTVIVFASLAAVVLGVVVAARWWNRPAPEPLGPAVDPVVVPTTIAAANFEVSGPFAHDNLALFLVHGADQLQGKSFLTLDEALAQKKFVILETQSVNQLTMENLSADEDVLILSGDILTGGQQDRIAQHDIIVPPKSGPLPLPAFCVEHTAPRWMRSMTAEDKTFAKNAGVVASNSARLAREEKGTRLVSGTHP